MSAAPPESNSAPSVLIIPAYQEAERLAEILDRVARAQTGCEVVVVDDGSTDASGDVAARAGATVLRHPFNLGYGAALQTGYKYALAARRRRAPLRATRGSPRRC